MSKTAKIALKGLVVAIVLGVVWNFLVALGKAVDGWGSALQHDIFVASLLRIAYSVPFVLLAMWLAGIPNNIEDHHKWYAFCSYTRSTEK